MATKKEIDPIAQFMQEHDVALEQLASLSKATRMIEKEGWTPEVEQRIARALSFLHDEVRVHNHGEEQALFPVLDRYVEGPTENLLEDHRALTRAFAQFRRAVSRVKKERTSKRATGEFIEVSRHMIQLFVNHIYKENTLLFPLVQKFLTKDALREVARRLL
jgi:hemerythrin-like domain-containing protein